jgi:hypothetical protein
MKSSDPRPFPLLELPAELRLVIYRQFFLSGDTQYCIRDIQLQDSGRKWVPVVPHHWRNGLRRGPFGEGRIKDANRVAILSTCRSVHEEAICVLYELAWIRVCISRGTPWGWGPTPSRFELVRNLQLYIEHDDWVGPNLERKVSLVWGFLESLGQGSMLKKLKIDIDLGIPMYNSSWPSRGILLPTKEFPLNVFEKLQFRGSGPSAAILTVPLRLLNRKEIPPSDQVVELLRVMGARTRLDRSMLRVGKPVHHAIDDNGFYRQPEET